MFCEFPEFGRCCLCLPLRRGVLIFGYLNIMFSMFMVGLYSYHIHTDLMSEPQEKNYQLILHGAVSQMAAELCLVVYIFEIIFNVVLVYGSHTKTLIYVKVFYYYAVTTTVATFVLQIIEVCTQKHPQLAFEECSLAFAGLSIQLYLIIVVRSLLRKLSVSGPHMYENQLQQVVTGEPRAEGNGIYNQNTVVTCDD